MYTNAYIKNAIWRVLELWDESFGMRASESWAEHLDVTEKGQLYPGELKQLSLGISRKLYRDP